MYATMMPQQNMYGYGGYGGGYPGMNPFSMGMGQMPMGGMPPMGGFGPTGPMGGGEYQQTLGDSFTGGISMGRGGFGGLLGPFSKPQLNEGYGLDFNRNGRYDRGQDGVLVFDTNRDGRYDQKDVQGSNDMMQAASGNFDFNRDGKVSMGERMRGAVLRAKFQKLDTNRDGRLDSHEIARGGGRVWMDQDRNGKVGPGETSSVFNIPANGRFGPTERLDFVDPMARTSHTSTNGMHGPFGGGGYPGGCSCGAGYGQPAMMPFNPAMMMNNGGGGFF
jgi:hypothetical protein